MFLNERENYLIFSITVSSIQVIFFFPFTFLLFGGFFLLISYANQWLISFCLFIKKQIMGLSRNLMGFSLLLSGYYFPDFIMLIIFLPRNYHLHSTILLYLLFHIYPSLNLSTHPSILFFSCFNVNYKLITFSLNNSACISLTRMYYLFRAFFPFQLKFTNNEVQKQ